MASVVPPYLLRNEFVDLRNRQDQELNAEFRSIRASLDDLNQRISRVEVNLSRVEVNLSRLEVDLTVETRRSAAFSRNQALRNPSFPIQPIPTLHSTHGILYPEPFPANANEFYSLRKPTTNRLRQLLAYLAVFYDIQPYSENNAPENPNSDEFIAEHPNIAVDLLENIFGLNEDNFVKFRARARELANQPSETPVKRSQILDEISLARRRRLDPPAVKQSLPSRSKSSEECTRLGWGKSSTPPSQRQTINNIPKVPTTCRASPADTKDGGSGSDSPSPTNANTSPRQSEIAVRTRGDLDEQDRLV